MKLTKTAVDKLPAPIGGYALHWDDSLPGFGVRITQSGAKSFVVQKRIHGKDRRLTVGKYGPLTVEQARTHAKTLLGHIALGGDPVADKARRAAEQTPLRQALADYLDARKNLKDRTRKDYRATVMWGCGDWLSKPVTLITPDRVLKRHAKLGKDVPARANLWGRYLRAVLNFAGSRYTDAEGRAILPDNPCKVIGKTRSWFEVKRRTGWIQPHQLKPWVEAVQGLNETARDYFLLVLLTGLRREEALGLKWADVDLEANTLSVRDTKNHSDHTLPMGRYLSALLQARHRLGERVFGRLANLRYPLETVRKVSGVSFMIHDLRRTFGTVAESLDVPSYAVKKLLNHKGGNDVTQGYLQITPERLRGPMQKIEDYLLKAAVIVPSAEVVELRKGPL